MTRAPQERIGTTKGTKVTKQGNKGRRIFLARFVLFVVVIVSFGAFSGQLGWV